MADEKVIMACSGVFSDDPAPVRTLLIVSCINVGKFRKMQAHSRFGRGYQILWYGRLRLLLVILLESGWNHHSPHQSQMHATEVPLGIRYLRAQYTPYSTTCSLQLITVSKGSDSRTYRALGTGHVGYPPPKISFIEL